MEYQTPDQKWSQEARHYNRQLELILEWGMQTEKAKNQWEDAEKLLELAEDLQIDIEKQLEQQLQEKIQIYEEEILEDDEYETDNLEEYEITIEDLDNTDNYNPPPV